MTGTSCVDTLVVVMVLAGKVRVVVVTEVVPGSETSDVETTVEAGSVVVYLVVMSEVETLVVVTRLVLYDSAVVVTS